MTTQDPSVPKYFADFVQENARQHQELSDRISSGQQELSNRIGSVQQELSNRISSGQQELSDRIGSVHQELSERLSAVEGELRIIKAVSVAIFVAVAAAAVKYLFGL